MFTTFRHLVKRGTSNFPGVKIPLSIHRNVIGLSPFSSAADDSTKIYRKIDPADIAASKNTNLNVGHKPYKYVAPFEKSAYADTKHTTGSISSEIDLSKRKLWKKVSPIKEKTDAEKAPLLTPLAKRIKHKPGSAGTKSSKSGGKGTNSYTRLFKADKISEFIATAFERRQSELLMEAYVYAE